MICKSIFVVILAFALSTALPASAQKDKVKYAPTSGTLTGEVTDQHGTPLAGTAVTVTNLGKQLSQSTTTDAQGLFRVDALEPGDYELSYEAKSFAALKQKTKIKVGKTTKVHAHLKYVEPS
jgi:protocatechuate 3,4-dioxygenase beta subunit